MSADTLLIVEDSLVQSKIIRKHFEGLTNFTILTAQSMAEAEARLAEHKGNIFAAVVGLNLPDAPNGETVDLCRRFDTPCIVLTASVDENLRRRFLEQHVADYFLKGHMDDMDLLVTSVERLHANHSVKALVVDDSATQRGVVKRLLAVQRIRSVEAADGAEALDVLAADPEIKLVITDFQMPRMNGIELVREIRAKHKVSRMAVIGLSSTGSGPLTAQFLKHGANDFLTKPFEVEEFYWRVNQTLTVLDVMEEIRVCRKLLAERK